ncbi:MAG: hypothetical protein JWM14_1503 [Chitinophagaceae bacterium]|nr:hypothetical protein [Chitinophagaceae bacterium]
MARYITFKVAHTFTEDASNIIEHEIPQVLLHLIEIDSEKISVTEEYVYFTYKLVSE